MKRVFIVHGWSGSPEGNWFPWMKRELQAKGISAEILHMPNTDFPKESEWVEHLRSEIGTPDEEVFLVGHSLGCMAIMRYVESLSDEQKIGGIMLVAGFSHSIGIPYLDDFFVRPLNYPKVRRLVAHKTFFASDDDPFVPLSEGKILEEMLEGKLIILPNAGHINQSNGFVAFSAGLDELYKMMNV